MQLFDGVSPTLKDGLHAITSTVVVDTNVASPDLNRALHRDFVQIGGSALHLQPTEVLACHPPRNGTGAYSSELPHVVLRRRTLPLERFGPSNAPWLALLVFEDSEVGFATSSLPTVVGPAAAAAFDAEEPGASGKFVDSVQVRDPALLRSVLPTPQEVGLLTHVRRVNTADTTLDMDDDDGWLAVVVANRLPVAPTPPVHYHGCLVSLEHRDDLYGQPATSSLMLLYRWDFITDSDGTFAALSENLDTGVLGQPTSGVTDDRGRATLHHVARDGSASTSTYRGPFTVEATPIADDPNDVSYDAAYELGRLLGAADGPFTRDLVDWHRSATQSAHRTVQQTRLRAVASDRAQPNLDLGALPAHVSAAATGLDLILTNLAPRAPLRRQRIVRREDVDG
jgi:hypothetical protein